MSLPDTSGIHGAGLGLRRSLMGQLAERKPGNVDFMEVAPENWINVGGRYGKQFRSMTEAFPFVLHGLSLSLGGPTPLDVDLVRATGKLMDEHGINLYTEHLSYCSDDGHLYDLMPIPFTGEAVHYVAQRIRQVQDILERPIAIENVSFYAMPSRDMTEIEFLNAVLREADCGLLLDVNNIYVNSVNHQYDAREFLRQISGDRIAYIHVAGHYNEADDLIIDTHGVDVIDPVWDLLRQTYQWYGVKPTLLERDFNIPSVEGLLAEVDMIHGIQAEFRARQEQLA